MSQWPLILPLRVFYFERSGFENRQMTNQHRVCSHFPKKCITNSEWKEKSSGTEVGRIFQAERRAECTYCLRARYAGSLP